MMYTRETIRDGLFTELAEEGERLGVFRPCTAEQRAESLRLMLDGLNPADDVWIFGYGSLLWNPAIKYLDRQPAVLHGWHRSFCLWTPVGRGTPDNPGLVLGLDRGGSCRGLAYRIAAEDRETELPLLWQREMVSDGYQPRWVSLGCCDDRIRAITWVINPTGDRYAGKQSPDILARHLATAGGRLGSSRDYLENTVTHLDELGIRDRSLHALLERVRDLYPIDGDH